jgi:glutamine synthetase
LTNDSYALTNPLSLLLDKPRHEFTREDLIQIIQTKHIERITFHYTALDGKLKELKIPISNRTQAEHILTDGERVDGSSLFKGMVDVSLSDLYVVPVYKTAFLNPFDSGSLDFICRYLTKEGTLAPFSLDNILYNAYNLFQKNTGLKLHAMGELEFFLLSETPSPIYPSIKQSGYHAASPFVKTGQLLNEIVRYITQITGSVKYAHSEVGYVESVRSNLDEIKGKRAEQLEIEFLPTSIDDAGDHLVLSRWLIRNISYRNGCVATFAPKLEEGIAGNGFHIHMELRKNGKNIMTRTDGSLSDEARKMIGGLCTYASSLTAFGNTVSSAYLRLVPNQEAPTRICWSDLNRSAMIRVPLGWSNLNNLNAALNPQQKMKLRDDSGSRQTVELRSPDGSAITYLLLAGITMAAEWGLTHPQALETAEKLYVTGNVFKNKKLLGRLPVLPKSCVESAKLLLKNRTLFERESIFPSSVIDYVSNLLEFESDEKMNQTLVDLPADDRLHETRKIMHKHLHRH